MMTPVSEQPSPQRANGSVPAPAAHHTVSRRLFAPAATKADTLRQAWRQVLMFLAARSEDGICCALSVIDGRNLAEGGALTRLRGPRPRVDAVLSEAERGRLEAMVQAAIDEVEGHLNPGQ